MRERASVDLEERKSEPTRTGEEEKSEREERKKEIAGKNEGDSQEKGQAGWEG